MLRKILGIVAGLVLAFVVISLVELAGTLLHPMPPGLDMSDEAALKAWIATLPPSAFAVVLLAHALGSLAGGAVAGWVARRSSLTPSIVVGVLLLLFGIANLLQVPHPPWFVALSPPLLLGGAWLSGRLVLRRS